MDNICVLCTIYNVPWLYGVASLRDLSVSNRDEPRGGEMQLVHLHHLAMTYEPLLGQVTLSGCPFFFLVLFQLFF